VRNIVRTNNFIPFIPAAISFKIYRHADPLFGAIIAPRQILPRSLTTLSSESILPCRDSKKVFSENGLEMEAEIA
jgi:hypothetical protein